MWTGQLPIRNNTGDVIDLAQLGIYTYTLTVMRIQNSIQLGDLEVLL